MRKDFFFFLKKKVWSSTFVSKEKESGRSGEIGVGGRANWWGGEKQPKKEEVRKSEAHVERLALATWRNSPFPKTG